MFDYFVFLHLEIRSCLFITKNASARIRFSSHVRLLCVSSIYFKDLPRIHLVLPVKYTKAHKNKREKKIKPEKRTSCPYADLVSFRHLFKRLPGNLENLRNGLPVPIPILWARRLIWKNCLSSLCSRLTSTISLKVHSLFTLLKNSSGEPEKEEKISSVYHHYVQA